jgi:hypothetical protein
VTIAVKGGVPAGRAQRAVPRPGPNGPRRPGPTPLLRRWITHLPVAWRERLGASIDWTWTFTLAGTGDGGTRLLLRVRGRTRPRWLTAAYVAALVPADHVMASSMLEGIRRRAVQPG